MKNYQNTHVDITTHVVGMLRQILPRLNGISQTTPEHTLNTCSVLIEGFGASGASERKLDICHLKIPMETSNQSIRNWTKIFPRLWHESPKYGLSRSVIASTATKISSIGYGSYRITGDSC